MNNLRHRHGQTSTHIKDVEVVSDYFYPKQVFMSIEQMQKDIYKRHKISNDKCRDRKILLIVLF